MLNYTTHFDPLSGEEWIETNLLGKELLVTPLLNKGTAFTQEEREELQLLGKLPHRIETLEEQLVRAKAQYTRYSSNLERYIYLTNLRDKNEVLFYKLLLENLVETIPLIYTPGVSEAVKQFSRQFRQPRGLYIAYPDREKIKEILANRTHAEIDLMVVTDGERILGIGDQGIGGMDIPIAKLVLYSLGGIDPYRTVPILLDVGTDNAQLLEDPLYLGWRHPRIKGKEYDDFIHLFVEAVHETLPQCFLHWEDFAQQNARRILETYRTKHCSFNDDMQGTGVVTLAALLSAIQVTKVPLQEQRVVVFGAGTAGVGIADQLYNAMLRQGIAPEGARRQFWLVDRGGLLQAGMPEITFFQKPYARSEEERTLWHTGADLFSVTKTVQPTILIGCSAVSGAFTEEMVRAMTQAVSQPIIFPLSNPTERCEAMPLDLLKWSEGKALIAFGSPFEPIHYQGKMFHVAQCNNALSFPGIGLGVVTTRATQVTDNMLWAASQAIAKEAPIGKDLNQSLLPSVSQIPDLTCHVGLAVAKQAIADRVATRFPNLEITDFIRNHIWRPYYRRIKVKK